MIGIIVLLAQTAAAWYGAGFIWTMQVLNYPLLARIGPDSFTAYETAHNARFIGVVGPGVVMALVTTALLFVVKPAAIPGAAPIAAAALLLVIVVSTILYQGRAHGRLARGFDPVVHATLVRSNWVRTAAWTILGLLDLWMLAQLMH